jgi:peroxiredoxin
MKRKSLAAIGLVAVILLACAWVAARLAPHPPRLPDMGLFHRSKVDGAGHMRGVVQVDLMRTILAGRPGKGGGASPRVPSQDHPLLGVSAPRFVRPDADGATWDLGRQLADGPVVLVLHLGFTCVACVTHLVELDAAGPRFRERDARVVALGADPPDPDRGRARAAVGLRFPTLDDPGHSVALAYGAWAPTPGGVPDEGEPSHATFLIGRDGRVRWAHVGDRPFRDVDALLAELDAIEPPPPR